MKFLAKDGATFDNIADCEKYEAELERKEAEKKRYSEKRELRWKEVSDAFDKYEELYEKYCNDYPNGYRDTWNRLYKLF